MIQMVFRRRKKPEDNRIFVDLEELAVGSEIEDPKVVVKTVDMRQFSDLNVIADMVSRNWMVVIETSQFEESEKVRKDAIEKMKAVAVDRGGRFFEISDRVALIAPTYVKVERCLIRRKA